MKKHNMLLALSLVAMLTSCATSTSSSTDKSSGGETSVTTDTSSEDSGGSETPTPTPSVKITSTETSVYITKQLTLTAEAKDTTDSIVWTSSDTTKATVDGGVVNALEAGEVKITAALSKDTSVKDEVNITVLDTIVDTSVNVASWDYSNVFQAEPTITSVKKDNTNDIKTYAAFKDVKGKQYVAKAHFDVKSVGDWAWNTLTIGHADGDGKIYSTAFSQNPKKMITLISDSLDGWQKFDGTVSDRSQIWNQHDLNTFDITNGVDVMSVRDNGDFYFFLNGELYWKDGEGFNTFDEIDTQPVIYLNGVEAEVSKMSVSTDADEVKKVVDAVSNKKFYPTFKNNVEISEDQTQIKFKNTDDITTNNKDVAAKSIGDAALLPANKEAKVEFDLVIDSWGSKDNTPAVCVDMKHWDSGVNETRTYLIGKNAISFAGWSYSGDLNAGYPAGPTNYNDGSSDIRMSENKTYHVVCTRLMTSTSQDCKLDVLDGSKTIATKTWGWANEGYTGNVVIYFSVRNVNATISNITFNI